MQPLGPQAEADGDLFRIIDRDGDGDCHRWARLGVRRHFIVATPAKNRSALSPNKRGCAQQIHADGCAGQRLLGQRAATFGLLRGDPVSPQAGDQANDGMRAGCGMPAPAMCR